MSSVENRIVSIKFDNAQFEQSVAQTLSSLQQLDSKISTVGSGASQGFGSVTKAANGVDLSALGSNVDKIASKFDALGAIGFSAINTITTSVLGFTKQFAETDILQPILGGGKQRAEDLQQAQFSFQAFGINVTEVMKDANDAVLGTAFSLSDAAKAAGQLAAAGVQAGPQMTSTLRAIAGVAAVTGDTFSDMSTLFTQSAAQGYVTNQDLLQLSTRGLNAAAFIAQQLGTTQQAVHAMATNGTLDFNTFATALDAAFGSHATEANETYTGALDNLHAALARVGAAFISPELDQKRDLFNVLAPALGVVQKALNPIEFTILGIRNALNSDLINKINAITFLKVPQITSFVSPNIAQGLQNLFNVAKQLGDTVKSAFNDIFPVDFTTKLVLFSEDFVDLTNKVKIGADSLDKIKSIFEGIFSIIDIGIAVVKGLISVVGDIVKALFPAGSGLLTAGAGLGNFLTNAKDLLVNGDKIQDFFDKLGAAIAKPISFISELVAKITDFFTKGFGSDAVSAVFDRVGDRVKATEADVDGIKGAWDKLMNALQGVFSILDTIWQGIENFFDQLKAKIVAELQPADFNSALDAVNVGLLGAITAMLKKFFAGGVKFGFGGGVFASVKTSLNNVTRSLQLMQTNLKAEALLRIASAMALLTVSIIALSLINSADLTKALSAIAVGFGELGAVFILLDKSVLTPAAAAKVAIISVAMIGMATAIVILSAAVKILSTLDLSGLGKGLAGVAGGMTILVVGANALDTEAGGMVLAGIGIAAIAIGLRILADAVKAFAKLSWSELGRGLTGVAAGLVLIVAAMAAIPPEGAIGALGFIPIALGLEILANVIKHIGNLSWSQIAKGIVGIAGALLAITIAMDAVPPTLPITAVGILIISVALETIGNVIKHLGSIPFGELVKGIAAIAAVMIILAVAVTAMDASVAGAVALVIIAGSLEVLADVMKKIGQLSIAELGTALGAIVAFLLVIGTLSVLGSEAIPFIAALGVALTLVGAGFALFGVGAYLTVAALGALVTIGVPALEKLVNALPVFAAALALFVVNFAQHVLAAFPVLIKVIGAVLDTLLDTLIKEIPKLGKAIGVLIDTLSQLIEKKSPELISAGLFLVNALLQGLGSNAKQIVDSAAKFVTNLSSELVKHADEFGQAAVNMIQAFIQVIDDSQTEIIVAAASLIVSLISGIGQGVGLIIAAAANLIINFITELGNHVSDIITAGATMVENLITGIVGNIINIVGVVAQMIVAFTTALEQNALLIIASGVQLIINFMFGIAAQALKLADAAGACILQFIQGLTTAVNTYEPQIITATIGLGFAIIGGIFFGILNSPDVKGIGNWLHNLGSNVIGWVGDIKKWVETIGSDIIHGIWNGISNSTGWFYDQIKQWATDAIGAFKSFWKILSPSKRFADEIGAFVLPGIWNGISASIPEFNNNIGNLATGLLNAFNPDPKDLSTTFATAVAQLNGLDEFNPTITPVLDLSKVKAAAGGISDALGSSTIAPSVSTNNATGISSDLLASAAAALEASKTAPTEPGDINFTQTINAPTALSTDAVYRGTRSQLTLAKEELKIPS